MIRSTTKDDQQALIELAQATGLFRAEELGELERMVAAYFASELDRHQWLVDDDGGLKGAAYYAPEMMAESVWNLYFIGVLPDCQGQGRGSALLAKVEQELREKNARLLLIQTSSLGSFALTRAFYRKHGYNEEARIRDFYKAGDDKVVFRKVLRPGS